MPTIASGASGSYTFLATGTIAITLASNQRATLTVSRSGITLYSGRLTYSQRLGPYPTGAVATMTAEGGTVTYTIQNERVGHLNDGSSMVTDGNSITALAGAPVVTNLSPTADSGWVNWGLAFSLQRMRWVEQRAISSNTTNNQRALLPSWVPYTDANCLFFMEGTNSIAGYVTAGSTDIAAAALAWADLQQYLADVRAYCKFKRIILGTIPPRGAVAARNAAHDWYNRQVRNLCAADSTYLLVDFWKVMVDPTSATLSARANHLRADDALHPTPKGCRAMGKEFGRVVNLLNLPRSSLIPQSSLTRAADAAALFMTSNPMMTGAGAAPDGTTGPGGTTGLILSGWRAGTSAGTATSMVASIITDADGNQAQRLVVTGGSSGGIVRISFNSTEAIPYQVANDYFKFIAKVAWSGATNVDAIFTRTAVLTDGNYTVDGFVYTAATQSVADYDNSDMTDPFYMVSNAMKFPGNLPVTAVLSSGIFVRFGAAGGAITLDVSTAGMLNLGQTVVEF